MIVQSISREKVKTKFTKYEFRSELLTPAEGFVIDRIRANLEVPAELANDVPNHADELPGFPGVTIRDGLRTTFATFDAADEVNLGSKGFLFGVGVVFPASGILTPERTVEVLSGNPPS